jgi:hypothetical protein
MYCQAPLGGERAIRLAVVAILSFALHALVLFNLAYEGAAVQRLAPALAGVGASAMMAASEPVDALILIPLQDSPQPEDSVPAVSSRGREAALEMTI